MDPEGVEKKEEHEVEYGKCQKKWCINNLICVIRLRD